MAANSNRTIVVTGATGKQGGAAFQHLKQRGFRALVRNPERPEVRELEGSRVEVLQGDFDDPESMERALDGADGAYSVQPWQGGVETEIRQGIAFAEAANREEVGHFVYSSVAAADQNTGIPHFESKGKIEERIRETGMPYTIFRPVFFMENWLMMRDGIDNGAITLPLSAKTRLQMIAVDDIGAFVALAFEHSGHWHNRAYELAGDELSMSELAEAFSRVSGREVRYQQVAWEQFEQQAGREMTVMFRWFEQKGYSVDIGAVRQQYSELTSFNRWLEQKWTRPAAQRVSGR
ncbi:MAG: NmrA/HSCARG family protein [Bryobacteraceae bacterium]